MHTYNKAKSCSQIKTFKDWRLGMHDPESRPFFIMKSCKECKSEFSPKISRQVFCSKKCGVKHGGREHYFRNKEARDAKRKEWADKNKEHLKEYMKVYHQDYVNPNNKVSSKKKKKTCYKESQDCYKESQD